MKSSAIALAALALFASSCGSSNTTTGSVPTLALDSDIAAQPSAPLAVKDLTFTQLAADSAAAFFKNATIIDVMGDTAILLEKDPEMSRLIIYNIKKGDYLGEVNHRGQGPGEYRVILGAFVNDKDATVLLPNFDNPSVYKYSLTTDSLIATIDRQMVMSMIEPVGGVNTAINFASPSPQGLRILQYDAGFNLVDSIDVDGFSGGNFNTLWSNAGTNGVFMIADTLYTIMPGSLQPTAILQRGEYALSSEQDRDLTMKVMSGANELELLAPYLLVRDIQFTDGKMLLTTMHSCAKRTDLYDLATGSLLYRSVYDHLSIPSSMEIQTPDGKTICVQSLFAKKGTWYGIVDEENLPGTATPIPGTLPGGIVSFRL